MLSNGVKSLWASGFYRFKQSWNFSILMFATCVHRNCPGCRSLKWWTTEEKQTKKKKDNIWLFLSVSSGTLILFLCLLSWPVEVYNIFFFLSSVLFDIIFFFFLNGMLQMKDPITHERQLKPKLWLLVLVNIDPKMCIKKKIHLYFFQYNTHTYKSMTHLGVQIFVQSDAL